MQKQAKTGCIFPVFGQFRYFRAHFSDVEGYGEEGKVHRDLVLAEVSEAAVCHVELHLSEDGLGFDASSASVPESLLRREQFPRLSFVLIEPMVHLNRPSVIHGFVAQTPQGTSLAVLRPVADVFAAVTACCL